MKPIVIDVHAHYTPALLFERFEAHARDFPGVKIARGGNGTQLSFPGDAAPRAVMRELGELETRLSWMDANGIDHQLLGGWVEGYGYDLPAGEGLAWSRFQNACMRDALSSRALRRWRPYRCRTASAQARYWPKQWPTNSRA